MDQNGQGSLGRRESFKPRQSVRGPTMMVVQSRESWGLEEVEEGDVTEMF